MSVSEPTHPPGDVAHEIALLRDLFRRRLLEDKAKNALIDRVDRHLAAREALDRGEALAGLMEELVLAVDRLRGEPSSAALSDSVAAEVLEVLARRGLTAIVADGMVDHAIHEVVGIEEAAEHVESGEILAVRRPGYRLGDRLLRPAQVVVAGRVA